MTENVLDDVPYTMRQLHIGKSTFYSLVRRGDIQIVKIGRRSLVVRSSVDAYVERLIAEQSDPTPAA